MSEYAPFFGGTHYDYDEIPLKRSTFALDISSTYVETPEALRSMQRDLASHAVLGVDLENHSLRSYHGYLCLMQISTPKTDYLVDLLALRP